MMSCKLHREQNHVEHTAAFFHSSEELCHSVADYIQEGLQNSEKVIIVYTQEHIEKIESKLKEKSIEIEQYKKTGQFVCLVAEETLPKIFFNGAIQKKAAQALIQSALSENLIPFDRIRVTGELVRLIWDQNHIDETLVLEDLWNDALTRYPAKLYCPYLYLPGSEISQKWDKFRICATHDKVITDDHPIGTRGMQFLQDLVLALETKNRRLELEIQARNEYENNLKTLVKERDDFISILGHELRTPLTSTTLRIQMLKKFINKLQIDSTIQAEIQRSVDICDVENNRMRHLIQNILDNTNLRLGTFILEKSKFDLSHLTSEVVNRFSTQCTYSNPIFFNSSASIIGYWDKSRMEQVLVNLISNAIKYGKNNPIEITVSPNTELSTAFLKVKDSGIGIRAEDIHRIFNKFERSQWKNYSGLGLGLYIVKQIIDAHGGQITVNSSLEAGSEFIVTLPLHCSNSL